MELERHMLIVDDEENVLFVLEEALSALDEGCTIALARDGQEALSQFVQHPPDLVITDIRLPKMDGVALTRAIREKTTAMPIIWITAYGGPEIWKKAAELQVYRCIDKPVEIAAIRQVSRQALGLLDKGGEPASSS